MSGYPCDVTVFVEQWKTLDINAKTTSKQVMFDSSFPSVSSDLLLFCFCSSLRFSGCNTRVCEEEDYDASQADKMCIVSLNDNNVFQDNCVKLRSVTFVYVYTL